VAAFTPLTVERHSQLFENLNEAVSDAIPACESGHFMNQHLLDSATTCQLFDPVESVALTTVCVA